MMVNRVPKLACKTFLRDYVGGMKVEALGNFPIERDLVVDMTHFIESPEAIKPYIIGNDRKPEDGPNVQTPAQMAKVSPVLRLHQLRPVLRRVPAVRPQSRVYRPGGDHAGAPLQPDNRDHGKKQRMPQLNGQNGVWSCTFVGYCSEVCPKHVDPAAAIQQGKVESAKDFMIAMLKPQ